MRFLTLAALVVCLAITAPVPARAQATPPASADLMAPIQKFIDSFNKGDTAGAASTHATGSELTIIDEVPPYLWRGSKAFHEWGAALDADAKKQGMTEPMVSISAPTRTEQQGDQAYVIVPAVFSFKLKGSPMRESAQMTFVLKKGAAGWLIHGWAWTGPRPMPVTASSKP
jgi:hypothetical protein